MDPIVETTKERTTVAGMKRTSLVTRVCGVEVAETDASFRDSGRADALAKRVVAAISTDEMLASVLDLASREMLSPSDMATLQRRAKIVAARLGLRTEDVLEEATQA